MKLPSASHQTRPIRFLELWRHAEWRIKVYGIASGRPGPREELVSAAKLVASEKLTSVASGTSHYAVGFLGVHDGRTSNFVFVDWWADENELHHHVYTSPCDDPTRLSCSTPTGVIACVWDLRLMAHERDAWLETVLRPDASPNLDDYLDRQLNEDV